VLREVADVILGLILVVFGRSWQAGEVLEDWKKANGAPVFRKEGPRTSAWSPSS